MNMAHEANVINIFLHIRLPASVWLKTELKSSQLTNLLLQWPWETLRACELLRSGWGLTDETRPERWRHKLGDLRLRTRVCWGGIWGRRPSGGRFLSCTSPWRWACYKCFPLNSWRSQIASPACGLYYNSFTIAIYDRNDSGHYDHKLWY